MCIFSLPAKSRVECSLRKQNVDPCANVQNHRGIPPSAAKVQVPITPQALMKSSLAIAYNHLVREIVESKALRRFCRLAAGGIHFRRRLTPGLPRG